MFEHLYPAMPSIPCKGCASQTGCREEGECYFWRCENPRASRKDEGLLGEFAELMVKVIAARFET